MSNYIGVSHINRVSPSFVKEDFLGSDLGTIYVDPQAVLLEDGNKIVLEDSTTPAGTVGGNIIQDETSITQEYSPAYELSTDVSGSNTENLQVVFRWVIKLTSGLLIYYLTHYKVFKMIRILYSVVMVRQTLDMYFLKIGIA